jgi:hypothetical protein
MLSDREIPRGFWEVDGRFLGPHLLQKSFLSLRISPLFKMESLLKAA